jgi:transcriptional regulator with XRE-family HTH domain
MARTKTPPAHDGDTVKALREAAGLTQYRLALDASISAQALAKIERTGGLQLATARKLATALGVSLAVFDRPA